MKSSSASKCLAVLLLLTASFSSYAAQRTFLLCETPVGNEIYMCLAETRSNEHAIDIERRLVTNRENFDNKLFLAIKANFVVKGEYPTCEGMHRVLTASVNDCDLPLAYQSDEYKAESETAEIQEQTRVALAELERLIAVEEQALQTLNDESI
ncbi:MAG: hypothetical protein ABIQ95_00750 [Bdellovibrionia bacterium]